ncbi:hypothetical protein BSKO_06421 [Bryopsis sp. KO-2023]|nr:hypothetical protein BSKO_06421 [Bryopsis sp. KO-2023]
MTILLLGIGFGLMGLHVENDVVDLWISQRGRIHKEKKFYEENFEVKTPQVSAFIIQGKNGVENLLQPKVLEEVYDLQQWIRVYKYQHGVDYPEISLENMCYKTLNREAQEPCFQYTPLDCFMEGRVFNVGGEKNSKYNAIYDVRPSYKAFDFDEDFTEEYVRDHCVQWTNVGAADTMLMGDFDHGVNSRNETVIRSVKAFRIAFGTKTPEALVEDGLSYVEFLESRTAVSEEEGVCPDADACDDCIETLDLDTAVKAGCVPGPVKQPDSCCELMTSLRASPCVEQLFQKKPDVRALGNVVFGACSLPLVELEKRCSNELAMKGLSQNVGGTPEVVAPTEEYQQANEDPPHPVCVCLIDNEDPGCATAAIELITNEPQWRESFVSAQTGNASAITEVTRILTEEVGCWEGDDTAEQEKDANKSETPDVCACLVDTEDPKCLSGAASTISERPDLLEPFSAASKGDTEAQAFLAGILINDLKCSVGRRRLQGYSPVSEDGGDVEVIYKPRVLIERNGVRTEKQARELLHGWEKAWQRAVDKKVKRYNHITVSWIASSTLDDTTEEAGKAQGPLLLLGYVLVLLYVILFFAFDRQGCKLRVASSPPGPFLGMLGFFSIILGVFSTFGIIGMLSFTSIKASAITVQIVPLLMVGLGINDFFVLASSLKSACDVHPSGPLQEIMKETMACGGTSVTLSSAANAAAFALGALSPIPAVMWFSMHMLIGVIMAYVVSMTIIPCILAWGAQRWIAGQGCSVFCCFPTGNTAADSGGEPKAPKTVDTPPAGPKLADRPPPQAPGESGCSRVYNAFILLLSAGLIGISIWGITQFDQGLNPSQAVPKGSQLYRFLKPNEEHFQSFPVYVVFKNGQDFSDTEVFQAARKAEMDFVIDGYKTDIRSKVTSWMEYYTQYVEAKVCANAVCLNEVEWIWDEFFSRDFGQNDICQRLDDPAKCPAACADYCPQGAVDSPHRCQLSSDERSCFCPWRPKLKKELFYETPADFDGSISSFWVDFLTNTTTGAVAQSLIRFDGSSATERNGVGEVEAFRTLAFVEDVPSVQEKLRHLKKGREVIDKESIDAFPFDYTVYAVGEQYDQLPQRTMIAVSISVVVAAGIMMPLILHWFTAAIVTFCILVAVTISAGISHWMGLHLNYALYVSLVVAVGLSVEFCAHIAREFMVTPGSRASRSRKALQNMGCAVFNGGITTFLGLLPVAWAKFPYFQRYFFGQYSVVVASGLFVGLGLLPVLLALIGPNAYVHNPSRKQREKAGGQTEGANTA